jgi:hypothetical protein
MATQDISRFLFQPTKHYSTAHMQQGRVIVDSDWNERADIEAEDLRASLLDIVCSKGSPNDGMKITDVAEFDDLVLPMGGEFNTITFNVGAGSYYIGGLRFVVDDGVTFLNQKDWLQLDSNDSQLPEQLTEGTRIDVVYVYAWEQPVTAVEDSELREVALGGRDTSTRVKRMRRFVVKTGVSSAEADPAFEAVKTELTATGAIYDAATCELQSGARLVVDFVDLDEEEDLCADPTTSGYIAAENQAIRVELRADGKWVWGFDNASKLYRVQAGDFDEMSLTTPLTFLTEPADLASIPRAGQVVELLQWGALLPNLEKVAEQQGKLTKVTTTYDPTTKTMVIAGPVEEAWIDWMNDHPLYRNPSDPPEEQMYLYLRVWDRGAELVDGVTTFVEYDVENAFMNLGTTGLAVKFPEGETVGIPGDYWIIAARPSTPERVVPWDLTTADGVPPHGPRRFYAPLATLSWTFDDPDSVAEISDIRTKLRRLCEGSCCTITVGDGEHSFGHVNSLEEAIALVADGDKICLLPGRHSANAVLYERSNVVIEGCGPSSVLASPTPDPDDETKGDAELFYAPVLTIRDSSTILVRNLRIEAHSAIGILVEQVGSRVCSDVTLEDLDVFATGAIVPSANVYEFAAPCIAALGVRDVVIRNCDLRQDVIPSITEVVVLGGTRLRLLDSNVIAPILSEASTLARGGVSIRSGSYDVDIIGCVIEGGWSHGISVGHVDLFERGTGELTQLELLTIAPGGGLNWILPNQNPDCLEPGLGGKQAVSNTTHVVLPLGPVEKVRIHDNVIRKMGLSGISTAEFFESTFDWKAVNDFGPVFIVAADFDICRNTIEDNVLWMDLPETFAANFDQCAGGICLAASINVVIRENRILRNGTVNYRVPVCGIGLVAAQNVTIEDNQIVGNGAEFPDDGEDLTTGMRGGIVINQVTPVRGFTFPQAALPVLPDPITDYTDASGGSAVIVRGNEVIQPIARALWLIQTYGAVTVTGNTLESLGNPGPLSPFFTLRYSVGSGNVGRLMGGACVEIYGYSKALDVEWTEDLVDKIPLPSWVDTEEALEDGGNTLVSGNAIRLSWEKIGGISTAVLVSTLASAVFDNNDVTVNMASLYELPDEEGPINPFYTAVLTDPDEYTYAISSVYVAGYSTGQANGNRITEGKFDALFSLTVGTIVRPGGPVLVDIAHAVSATANMLTHAFVLISDEEFTDQEIVQGQNAVIFPQLSIGGYDLLPAEPPVLGIGRQLRIVND